MKVYYFLAIFCLILQTGFSQGQIDYSTKSKKAIKLYEEADVYIKQRRFTQAIQNLTAALEKDR